MEPYQVTATAPSWLPTRKWAVNLGTLVTGLLLMWVTTGAWGYEETTALITLIAAAVTTYLVPNGVLTASPTRKWFVNVIALVAGLGYMWAKTGAWDQEETVALITLLSTAFATYMVPNDPSNQTSP